MLENYSKKIPCVIYETLENGVRIATLGCYPPENNTFFEKKQKKIKKEIKIKNGK